MPAELQCGATSQNMRRSKLDDLNPLEDVVARLAMQDIASLCLGMDQEGVERHNCFKARPISINASASIGLNVSTMF